MYIEYKHNSDKDSLKFKLDDHISRMLNLQFQGNFEIIQLNKSWTDYEMQFSIMIKQGVLERKIKGTLKIRDDQVIISMELPEIIKNFITEEKLRQIITRHLDNLS